MDRLINTPPGRIIAGEMAQVTILTDRVILTPTDPWNKAGLLEKIKQEKLFRTLTTNVTGLQHPKILTEDEQKARFEVERAKGINLSSGSDDASGSLVDFLKIPLKTKIKGMISYLETIATLNQQGYSFVDHKGDSIFLDPKTETISIVDTSALREEPRQNLVWVRENSSQPISGVLKAFFTKGFSDLERNEEGLVPRMLLKIIEDADKKGSANEVLDEIRKWINTDTKRQSPEESRSILTLLARGFEVEEWLEQKMKNTKLELLSEYQYSLLEAELYVEGILKSGNPQELDKRVPHE